jgi:hypothetical protein
MPDTPDTSNELSLTLAQEYLYAPVRVVASSPDPRGRTIRVVDHVLDTSLLAAAGVSRGLDASIVLPVRIAQTGSGVEALTSQSPTAPPRSALRDPRVGLAYSFDSLLRVPGLGLKSLLETSLPLGNQEAFAGDRSLVIAPRLLVSGRSRPLYAELGVGTRLREQSRFAGVRVGNQLLVTLGFGVDALPKELLAIALEAWALPALGPSTGSDSSWTPAEWLLSAQSRPTASSAWTLQLAGGGGLPLSRDGGQRFAGLTSPELRLLASARYSFSLSSR